jgi:hypothetical protein
LKLLAKLAVSAAIVALIAMRLDLLWIAAILARVDAGWLALAVAVFQLGQLASAERFYLIARRVARGIGFVRSLGIHYIGVWFNQVLRRGLGGDAVKVVLLRHDFGLDRRYASCCWIAHPGSRHPVRHRLARAVVRRARACDQVARRRRRASGGSGTRRADCPGDLAGRTGRG